MFERAAVDELQSGDAEIGSRLAHQLGVRTALHDTPVVHHDDRVSSSQRAQAVGDDERGAAGNGAIQGFEDLVFRFAVDGSGRIIQEQNGGFEQHGACDGEPLSLTARKTAAAFAEDCFIAFGQGADEVVGRGDTGSFLDLLLCSFGMTERDICRDRVREQKTFLEHETNVPSEIIDRETS